MLLFLATAFGGDCITAEDRADTSCWLDDWHTEGRATMDIGIKGGKKWVQLLLDGDVVQEGKLEGARAKRTAAMDGCGGTFVVQDDGAIEVTLDGPECAIEAAGTYKRGKKSAKPATKPTLCKTETLFSCEATDGSVVSVCEADGKRTLMTGPMGGEGVPVEGGSALITSTRNDMWTFKDGDLRYSVTISNDARSPGARLTVEMGSATLEKTDCKPFWFRKE